MLELIGVDELTQWDVGRQVKVDKDVDMVHFSNRPYGYSKNVKVTNGVADVPDMFLTSCAPLHIWAYIGNFEKGYTKIEKIYEVKPKNRPEDYIYTPEEVKTWEKLQSEIGDLADLKTGAKENLVAAINEVAADISEGIALDTTLTQSGKAADAKAVGDALAEKQPKGDYLTQNELPDMTAYRTAEAQDVIDAGKQDVLIQSGATVGQIAKITAVDDTGKPTAWEAVDLPSGGGGGEWRLINTFTIETEDLAKVYFNTDLYGNPFELRELWIVGNGKNATTHSGSTSVYIFTRLGDGTTGNTIQSSYPIRFNSNNMPYQRGFAVWFELLTETAYRSWSTAFTNQLNINNPAPMFTAGFADKEIDAIREIAIFPGTGSVLYGVGTVISIYGR